MLPTPRLFRSRWAALAWAGGMLWFAWDVAGTAPHGTPHAVANASTDATGEEVTARDLAVLANAMGGD